MPNDHNFLIAIGVIVVIAILAVVAFMVATAPPSRPATPVVDLAPPTPVPMPPSDAQGAVVTCSWSGPHGSAAMVYTSDDYEDADSFQASAEARGWECAGRSEEAP